MAAIFLLSMVLVFVPAPASASQFTNIQCKFTMSSQEVDVSPGQSGIITYNGEVEVNIVPSSPNPAIVQMTASAQGWPTAISPSTMIFTGAGGKQTFQVSVAVPNFTPFTSNGQLKLDGLLSQGATIKSCTTNAIIKIIQYFRLNVISDQPYMEIAPGDIGNFVVTVDNLGNGADEFEILIDNADDLGQQGWISPPTTIKRVELGQPGTVNLQFQSPQQWTPWKNDVQPIKIKVISSYSKGSDKVEQAIFFDYALFVRQKGFYIDGFDPVFAIIALAGMAAMVQKRRLNTREDEDE